MDPARRQGHACFVDGEPAPVDVIGDALAGPMTSDAPLTIGRRSLGPPFLGQIDDLRVYGRALEPGQVANLAIHYPARVIISGVFGKRSAGESEEVRDYFLTNAAPEALRTASAELKALNTEKEDFEKTIPTAMVMADMKKPRDTFVLARGDYRNPTEKVQPGVPAMLPPLPKDAPLNRLTLAQWLVDPSHPLTARVAVNRFWQQYFGTGIVKTQEDFGVQGEPPVHPELLDWLATEFVRTGWDVKAMQRAILTSATYRQSSSMTTALRERDPDNRLLARASRFRFPAETIRDTALAASGFLNPEIGGPSALPYQPKGLWEEMAFGEGFSGQAYEQSHGQELYRRGMYTLWKRSVPPASLAIFDAPDREKCTARRGLTNTPLQALTLMTTRLTSRPPAPWRSARCSKAGRMTRAGSSTRSGWRWRARRRAGRSASCASCSRDGGVRSRPIADRPCGSSASANRRATAGSIPRSWPRGPRWRA